MTTLANSNAQWDEERGKLEALRAVLEARQFKLTHEEADMETMLQVSEEQRSQLKALKQELMKLGKVTLENRTLSISR